jgi:starch phosphorylase
MIAGGAFSKGDRDLFRPLVDSLLSRDDYLLFHDFEPYVQAQARVSSAYAGQTDWTRKSILNSARVGRFSSDRSIREYCRDIWGVAPLGPAGSA